jgi:hypothetical protein
MQINLSEFFYQKLMTETEAIFSLLYFPCIPKTFFFYFCCAIINKYMYVCIIFVYLYFENFDQIQGKRSFLSLITLRRIRFCTLLYSSGCSFKFLLKVGVEESIANAPHVSLQNKNTNNAKSETICNAWCVHNRLFNDNFEEKFKGTPDIY